MKIKSFYFRLHSNPLSKIKVHNNNNLRQIFLCQTQKTQTLILLLNVSKVYLGLEGRKISGRISKQNKLNRMFILVFMDFIGEIIGMYYVTQLK